MVAMIGIERGHNPWVTIKPGDFIPSGWFHDGEQVLFHDSTGNFFIAGQWYARPDLLVGMPPPPPTWGERARMEQERLSTPWPTYREAWREAKALKSWTRRWALYGLPFAYAICSLLALSIPSEQTEGDYATFPMFIPQVWVMLAVILSGPFCFWKVYYEAVKRQDAHKAAALVIGSYAVLAVGTHALARADDHSRRMRHPWTQ